MALVDVEDDVAATPRDDAAVSLECEVVEFTCRDRDHAASGGGRDVALSIVVVAAAAPGNDAAVLRAADRIRSHGLSRREQSPQKQRAADTSATTAAPAKTSDRTTLFESSDSTNEVSIISGAQDSLNCVAVPKYPSDRMRATTALHEPLAHPPLVLSRQELLERHLSVSGIGARPPTKGDHLAARVARWDVEAAWLSDAGEGQTRRASRHRRPPPTQLGYPRRTPKNGFKQFANQHGAVRRWERQSLSLPDAVRTLVGRTRRDQPSTWGRTALAGPALLADQTPT